MKQDRYYSNGKLLITGEYLVLDGALSLAVPTRMGQELLCTSPGIPDYRNTGVPEYRRGLYWESYYQEECWFRAEFSIPDLKINNTNIPESANYLKTILEAANSLNPAILNQAHALNMQSSLEFSPEWGLGSSSTLINNIASLFKLDPYELFFRTQKGSAYDVACAARDNPIFYRLDDGTPLVKDANFDPPHKENLAFVYSGRKQDSHASLGEYLQHNGHYEYEKGLISRISRELVETRSAQEFAELLDEHEAIMSKVLGLQKIKESRFPDFPGSLKSLGAWGGDFILAYSDFGFYDIKSYFSKKGLDVVFGFDELVLTPTA